MYIISALRGLFGGARGLIMLNLGGARMGEPSRYNSKLGYNSILFVLEVREGG